MGAKTASDKACNYKGLPRNKMVKRRVNDQKVDKQPWQGTAAKVPVVLLG